MSPRRRSSMFRHITKSCFSCSRSRRASATGAKEFLRDFLLSYPDHRAPQTEIEDYAKAEKISDRTLRRAKTDLLIRGRELFVVHRPSPNGESSSLKAPQSELNGSNAATSRSSDDIPGVGQSGTGISSGLR
jgi:hypothetical protein